MFQHSFPPLHSWSRLKRTNRYTYRQGDHIRTLDIGKLLRFIVFGFFLAGTDPNPPINLKSMFQHSFPPLHSWSRLRRTNWYTYQLGEHPIYANCYISWLVFGYLLLAETDPSPPTNPKSMFQHSFPPLHSWSCLRQTNRYTYRQGDHIRTLDIGKLLRFIVFGFFLAGTDPNPPINLKSMFQHSFPPLHSWSRLRRMNWYTYQLGEHPIYTNCYVSWFTVTFFGWNRSQSTN